MSSPSYLNLLGPVVGLNLWTFVMQGWMYSKRLPAMGAPENKHLKFDAEHCHDDLKKLPGPARWPAENYNHLHEQPTIFYAVMLTAALVAKDNIAGASDLDVKLAWTYVGIRIIHSILQSTTNTIVQRFGLFSLGSGVLGAITVRLAQKVFQL